MGYYGTFWNKLYIDIEHFIVIIGLIYIYIIYYKWDLSVKVVGLGSIGCVVGVRVVGGSWGCGSGYLRQARQSFLVDKCDFWFNLLNFSL